VTAALPRRQPGKASCRAARINQEPGPEGPIGPAAPGVFRPIDRPAVEQAVPPDRKFPGARGEIQGEQDRDIKRVGLPVQDEADEPEEKQQDQRGPASVFRMDVRGTVSSSVLP